MYKTLGWQIDTWAISEGFADEQMFWDDMTWTVAQDRNSVQIEVDGQKRTLKPGEWTDWVDFTFPFNPLIKLRGISRFHLIAAQPVS